MLLHETRPSRSAQNVNTFLQFMEIKPLQRIKHTKTTGGGYLCSTTRLKLLKTHGEQAPTFMSVRL